MTSLLTRVGLTATAMALLGACGTTAAPPQVASIPTPASSGTSAAPPAASSSADRPQLRLDMSDEDVRLAWVPYGACLKANGHKMYEGRGDGLSLDQDDNSPTAQAARKTCEPKLPAQPPELDHSKPDYSDKYHAYITCMNDRGLAVTPIDPFGTGWTYTDGVTQQHSSEENHKIEKDCQLDAFKG